MTTLSACATSSGSVTSAANPAPVHFKAGKVTAPSNQFASVGTIAPTFIPGADNHFASPRATQPAAPSYASPSIKAPSYAPAPQSFDQANVDPELYLHQKVGRPYKIKGKRYTPKHDPKYNETGIASWYGPNFHGKLTANGEVYDQHGMTAAHKTLPLNSMVFVTNVENGKTAMLRVNDRGPFVDGRIIDLSHAAAKALGIAGLGNVRVQYAGPADPNSEMAQGPSAPEMPRLVEAPEPVAPAQKPAPQRAEIAPTAPAPEAPAYKPLSVIPHSPIPQFVAPEAKAPADTVAAPAPLPLAPRPVIEAPQVITPAPKSPQYSSGQLPPVGVERVAPLVPVARGTKRPPQTFTPPADGGVMTLTISGPIHMASADANHGAVWMPAMHDGPAAEMPKAQENVHYVQAVTFSSMARAASVHGTLSAAGPVTISDIERGGKTLHRVLVGPFANPHSAANAQSLIATLGYSDAKVVKLY